MKDKLKEIDILAKDDMNYKEILTKKQSGNLGCYEILNLWIIGIEER